MRGTAPGRVVASDDDWWAEPLRSMLSRMMVNDLGLRLQQTVVLLASGAIPGPPDLKVQVELQRLLTGTIAIEAAGRRCGIGRLGIRVPAAGVTAAGVTVAGVTVADQVAAMTAALARAADLVANRRMP